MNALENMAFLKHLASLTAYFVLNTSKYTKKF